MWNFRAVCYASSRWWNRNASTCLKHLNISTISLFLIYYFEIVEIIMNILGRSQPLNIFIWIISILLEILNSFLIDHIDLTLIYYRYYLFLSSYLFVTYLTLNRSRNSFKFFQLWTPILTSFMARFLSHIYYLLLHHIGLFIFVLKLF